MKITFIRHAESSANAEKVLALDSAELSANGIKQAKDIANELKKSNFDIIISSPIKRTLDTAKIIGEIINAPTITEELLAEKNFGSFAGKPLDEVFREKEKLPNLRDRELGYNYHNWGGESGQDIKDRVLEFTEKMKIDYKGKNVLAVSHAGIIRIVHVLFSKREYKEYVPIPNVSVHKFEL